MSTSVRRVLLFVVTAGLIGIGLSSPGVAEDYAEAGFKSIFDGQNLKASG